MGLRGEFLKCQSLCGAHILAFIPGRRETSDTLLSGLISQVMSEE